MRFLWRVIMVRFKRSRFASAAKQHLNMHIVFDVITFELYWIRKQNMVQLWSFSKSIIINYSSRFQTMTIPLNQCLVRLILESNSTAWFRAQELMRKNWNNSEEMSHLTSVIMINFLNSKLQCPNHCFELEMKSRVIDLCFEIHLMKTSTSSW